MTYPHNDPPRDSAREDQYQEAPRENAKGVRKKRRTPNRGTVVVSTHGLTCHLLSVEFRGDDPALAFVELDDGTPRPVWSTAIDWSTLDPAAVSMVARRGGSSRHDPMVGRRASVSWRSERAGRIRRCVELGWSVEVDR